MNKDLKKLSDSELLSSTMSLVQNERRITAEVLLHLRENESRMLYAACGYSSLFEYCIRELKYSKAAAWRRISAMRLLKELPETEAALVEGTLSVSGMSRAQSAFERERKEGSGLSLERKREVIDAICNAPASEVEKRLAQALPSSLPQEKLRHLDGTHAELTVVIDQECQAMLARLSELCAHVSTGCGNRASLIKHALKIALDKIDPEKKKKPRSKVLKPTSRVGSDAKPDRHIPAQVARVVRERDGHCCTYVDPQSKRQCGSKYDLEIDHIFPFALGGPSIEENLRLLCRTHNKLYACQVYGNQDGFTKELRT